MSDNFGLSQILYSIIGIPCIYIEYNNFVVHTVYKHGWKYSHFWIGVDRGSFHTYTVTLSEYKKIRNFLKQDIEIGKKLSLDCSEDVRISDNYYRDDKFVITYERTNDRIIISFSCQINHSNPNSLEYKSATFTIKEYEKLKSYLA